MDRRKFLLTAAAIPSLGINTRGWAQEAPSLNSVMNATHPYAVNAQSGKWMILVKSYIGLRAPVMAEEFCTTLRRDYRLPAYLFNRGAEAKKAEHERIAAIQAKQQEFFKSTNAQVMPSRGVRTIRIEEQLAVFQTQLALAVALDRPVTVHCIDAFGLLLETLSSVPLPPRGFLLHAYSGSLELVAPFVALGAYFSFNGAYLASRHTRLRELYQKIPLDRLLVETDAPAMLPPPAHAPHTFAAAPTLNHPANLAAAYAALATLRDLPLPALTAQIADNYRRLFLAHFPA